MLTWIDNTLNRVTMYRLIFYYLVTLLVAAFIFCFFGILPYDPTALAFSAVLITGACWVANWVFSRVFEAATNVESVYITAFILALIIRPVTAGDPTGVGFLIFASVWAMASKYMFAMGKKHVFNPAAFGVALAALTINQSATWWVGGNIPLLPIVFIGGALIVRKIRRADLVASFMVAVFAAIALTTSSAGVSTALSRTILHSSFFFFAFVMLTEPLTTPPSWPLRTAYGAFVGLLFAPNTHFGSFYLTPELALLIGNLFSYAVSPKGRFMLALSRIEEPAKDVYDFIFTPDRRFSFEPGQYLEWTLGHQYPDNRGNRRYFTIASSPTENEVRLGVKFYPQSSSFKRSLAEMKQGGTVSVSHLAGDFVLPRNPRKKLIFIAGGIGVTPFRSMIQYLIDTKQKRDIVVFYSNKKAEDIAYKDVFDRAQRELGIKVVYAVTNEPTPVPGTYGGMVDPRLIMQQVPDWRERTFYISGPHGMVDSFKTTLRNLGVSRFRIKSDFFPGFA
ncbi:MAG: RnfABCDGE type electron transport complex subunit D [Patescibacteria group bacterium]|nr:RnfABCDGE type electron transport complex subunit D [Patescibacteria group bacterium]